MFKKILDKYNGIKLNYRIAIAIVLGTLLGIFLPEQRWIGELGVLFVGAMKGIAPILVFVLIVNSLSTGKTSLDRRFGKVFAFYMISTILAAIVAVTASFLFPQNLQLAQSATTSAVLPKGIGEILNNLLVRAVSNPFEAITDANYIGILVWAIIFGIALKLHASDSTKDFLQDVTKSVTAIVHWLINFAPFGILGLIHSSIATNGIGIFKTYGMLVAVLAGAMIFTTFIIAPLVVSFALKQDPYPLVIYCLKQSAVTALFTRSSAANIPVNMDTCEKLKLDREFYSVSIPLGATINMNGAAITIAVMTLAAAHTLGIAVSFPTALILCVVATIGACGASGIAGGSLFLIPMACSFLGISNDIAMQVVAVGFIIGAVQDSLETALNSSTDVMYTAAAEYSGWVAEGKHLPRRFR
ncbi:serine/threonine transporter [Fibrobacter sp. UWT2]|jgi:serine/threonine transporter|uniref:serine/threonine transporter SstT n=1 Tax=Fibrobacter sp. UWT2 TaxID=1896224 RepID=UPI0009142582|nr:serine/threonine transporter SstT [Fibrobacter sp. UWT2]SHK83799.1 serine/threonine transporter [Fibrobacter sp. UWT2]